MATAEIPPGNLDIIAFELIPVEHLFRSLYTGARIPLAPDGGHSCGNRSIRSGTGHGATEGHVVHVGLTAT